MGNNPLCPSRRARAPKALQRLTAAASRSLNAARLIVAFPAAEPGRSVCLSERLEPRQMLSSTMGSTLTQRERQPLAKLDSILQSTYQSYEQFIKAQPVDSEIATTKKEKTAKAAAIAAVSATFSAPDADLHSANGDIPVQAYAITGDGNLLRAALKKLSAQAISSTGREVDADLPIADLGILASLKSLDFAESSASVVNVGAVTSQGDAADEAATARADYGINGAGVKVGIISDSFNNNANKAVTDTYATDVATGDLPAGVQILSDNVPGTDEGRAIAQVIYDSAPGVSLAFADGEGGANGQTTMADNIAALVSDGANIIVDDVTYETEPMFADGPIAEAAETAIADGVTYISAAGNLGSDSYASTWRSGPNLSAGSIATDPTALNAPTFYGGVTFNFATSGSAVDTDSFTLAPGQVFNPSLQWDSPYYSTGGPGTSNQLDFYVLNAAGTEVEGGSSALVVGNTTPKDPIQNFIFQNSTGTTNTYKLMICCSIGSVPGYIKWVDFAGQASNFQYAENSSTIFGHANASGVESVGAVNYAAASSPVLESYSSTGGTPIIFNTAGTRLTSYGYRQTPAVVAPDDVYTTFFGTTVGNNPFPSFSGTSAAAAEVAGLAALLKQKDPQFTPQMIDAALNNNTITMGSTSPNNQSGYGFIQALPVIANSVGNITGTVFSDNNANGIADPGEPGLANAIVFIDKNGNGTLEPNDPVTATNSSGFFAFYNQSLGTTAVDVVPLTNYVQTNTERLVNVLGAQTVSGVYLGLFPTLFSGTAGKYNYMVQTDPAKAGILDIFINGSQAYNAPLSILEGGLTFDLEGGNSTLTVSFINGNPIPTGGISYTPTGTGNSLIFNGSASADTGVIDAENTTFDGSSVAAQDLSAEAIYGDGGNDNFVVATAQPSNETLTFNGGTGVTTLSIDDPLPNSGVGTTFNAGTANGAIGVLNVNVGTWTFMGNPGTTSTNLTVNDSSDVIFNAGAANSGINTRQIQALNISSGSIATVAAPDVHADRAVLVLSTVAIVGTGYLDLNSNDMIVTGMSLSSVTALLASGYNGGAWNGPGLQSSAAASDTTQLTALGVISNQGLSGTALYSNSTSSILGLFDGMSPAPSAVLVKYTDYGDANLSGVVDGSDYSRIDNGFTQGLTGWYNGDFNYDGTVNGSDYTLIDNAFNSQGKPL